MLSADHLEARTRLALMYYSNHRPHQGIGGATPAEVYFDTPPAIESAVPPPRKHEARSAGETHHGTGTKKMNEKAGPRWPHFVNFVSPGTDGIVC